MNFEDPLLASCYRLLGVMLFTILSSRTFRSNSSKHRDPLHRVTRTKAKKPLKL
jgi:hypothetical protein